jgi:H+/Cl- antiporter ClcA
MPLTILAVAALLLIATVVFLKQLPNTYGYLASTDSATAAGGCSLAFLFGAFCALWAQNQGRNAWLWFILGFLLNIVAVLFVLILNVPVPNSRASGSNEPIEQINRDP